MHTSPKALAHCLAFALVMIGLSATAEIAGGDWPTYGGQASGTQYSALKQINLNNVDQLEVAWTYHTGELSSGTKQADKTAFPATPIYANNRLYLCTPFNHIVALDPGTGKQLWRFDPKRPLTGTFYGSNSCRGVTYWQAKTETEKNQFCGKRLFEAVQNGVLVSVDADTGQPCTGFGNNGRIDLNQLDYKGDGQIHLSSPPAVYQDVVIIGSAIYDNKWGDAPDGIVRAFDARTGSELWHWNPIPAHLSSTTGAANTWAPISIDHNRGWVFLPTGSPSYDVYGAGRRDPIPFGNAVVVLNALSGELIWSYQTVHHDLWDYDLPSMPTLVQVEQEGQQIPAVLQATKMGYVFVLNRLTGESLFPVKETPVPQTTVANEYSAPTQPIPKLPAPVTSQTLTPKDGWGLLFFDKKACDKKFSALRNEGLYTPPSTEGSILHPSFLGGSNWGGIAYDQTSGLAVLNSSNLAASVTLVAKDQYDPAMHRPKGFSYYEMIGSPYVLLRGVLQSPLGMGIFRAPCNPPPWGQLTAIDIKSGETRWQIPFGQMELPGPFKSPAVWGAPNQGGPIITAGGLVFIGASPDNLLRAYDLETGKLLWRGNIPAPAIATPMTFSHGVNGRQYIAVAAGGHQGFQTTQSDTLIAFALPEQAK